MKEKMKQNKKYVAIFCVVIMLSSFISLSAFAYTDTSTNGKDFDGQPLPVITSNPPTLSEITSDGFIIDSYVPEGSANHYDIYCYTKYDNAPVYCFLVNGYQLYAISTYQNFYCNVKQVRNNNEVYNSSTIQNNTSANKYNDYYWGIASSSFVESGNPNIPNFNSVQDGINAVIDWIENPPSTAAPAHVAQFTLPAGNAVVIDLGAWDNSGSDRKIQLSQTTQYAHPQNWSTNQFYAYTSELPNSISTPFPGQNPINWVGYGKTTLFNQVFSFNCNLIYASSLGRYLVIINPFVPEDHDTDNYNAPISVYVGQCSGYKFYQLKTDVTQTGAFGGEGDGTTGTGTYDPDSGTWSVTNDQTGEIWAPSQGGGNSNNAVLTVSGWLEQISHQIGDFFTGAIGAVSNLINAGSAFFNVLVGLYTWLPPAVLSVLSSALIVVITVGVIKVFI